MTRLVYLLSSGLLVAAAGVSGSNLTSAAAAEREGRQNLGVFNVVTFPNDACGGTNNLNGTCYTASECTSKGGTASGACASGFGVCCTFSLACGASASENNTYAIMTSYDTTSDEDPCIYTFCKASTDICKLRIDFETMTVDTSSAYVSYATAADIENAKNNGLALGKCDTDFVTITNPGGVSPPKICGVNTGQHMFLDASDSCNEIKVDIDTGTSTSRSWQIKVTQYTCESQDIPRENCLQYHTGTSGTFYSFGWDTSVTAITATSHNHLQDQYYEICFRRERGYCSLCLTPQIYSSIAATSFTSFGVSGAGIAAGQQTLDSYCGGLSAAIVPSPIHQDYIEIINLQPSIGTTATAGVHKICGFVWNSDGGTLAAHAAAAAIFTSCTWTTPFKWGVRFNGLEIQLDQTTAAAANSHLSETAEQTTGSGIGTTGFYMAYWQNVC